MGHKHSKDDILEGALAAAFDEGLSQLTFGRLAKRLDISDRIVVYYFPTKNDLIGEVLHAIGAQLQATLAPAFAAPAADHRELLRTAWPILARPDADPVFALFFEAGGLAAIGREPFRTLVPQLVDAWIAWVSTFVGGTASHRRAEAEAAIAVLDGLLLLRQLAGPSAANRAAGRVGVGQRPSVRR
jgi:AcrR family transcriptional regulator